MARLRLNRVDVYRKICRKLRLGQSTLKTAGYFDTKQMRLILDFIDRQEDSFATDKPIKRVPAIRVR